MFPNEVRNITWSIVTNTYKSVKCLYSFSRTATWIFFSSSLILFAPVIFEIERANMEEVQRREQKQVRYHVFKINMLNILLLDNYSQIHIQIYINK